MLTNDPGHDTANGLGDGEDVCDRGRIDELVGDLLLRDDNSDTLPSDANACHVARVDRLERVLCMSHHHQVISQEEWL